MNEIFIRVFILLVLFAAVFLLSQLAIRNFVSKRSKRAAVNYRLKMIREGALIEARANLATWSPDLPSAKAIGAAELMAHLRGEISLEEAAHRATVLTRQFAKRQRSWFRARMRDWPQIAPAGAGA